MAKVFTIAEGLENMGALKSGGQGSVYKGRRMGEIITAIKILPTPIFAEAKEDKNYLDFQNEVRKLQKVNERPNPHVVKILSSGLTESGSFPFIEMEYIEGPDLEELLRPAQEPLFTVKEIIKVAEQLSNALAHCHSLGIKHGDIKSNNVKLNVHSGNYVLLDFGLAIMSDEQRRTSLRHAGAIEFMAPEQSEGELLFQSDVYSYGVILYELLAGRVPFPLQDRSETARNLVMLSHIETPPPDVLALRKKNIPASWSPERREHELNVPQWLVEMIYRCLAKQPQQRFANGTALYEFVLLNNSLTVKKGEVTTDQLQSLQQENQKLLAEKDRLQKTVLQYQKATDERERELTALKGLIAQKENELQTLRNRSDYPQYSRPEGSGTSRTAFTILLLFTIGLGAFAAYTFFYRNKPAGVQNTTSSRSTNHSPYEPAPADNSFEQNKIHEERNNRLPERGAEQPSIGNPTEDIA
ncbi:MAG: protein kinase, partial [Nitrososphaera sp.]|nr:protein kinase [Nitrososphaera sp.]